VELQLATESWKEVGYIFGGHGGEKARSGKHGNSGKLIQRQVEKGMEGFFSTDGSKCQSASYLRGGTKRSFIGEVYAEEQTGCITHHGEQTHYKAITNAQTHGRIQFPCDGAGSGDENFATQSDSNFGERSDSGVDKKDRMELEGGGLHLQLMSVPPLTTH